ncbi:MAG TPA: spore germination protein, partial [Limnochordia bacterium]
ILVDGSPFALIVPATLNQFYHTPEDYYERWLIGSLIRFVRVLAVFFSLTTTALYVALISFHPEMIPTSFAIAIAGGRAGVPVPSIVEALLMEVTMEVLREASVRLPRPIGPTIGIVGAIVIGEAATRAGLVSPLMVIVVAVTSVGSFAIPSYSAAIALRILKFPMIFAAGTFGLYGIMIGLIAITIHLATLESFGVPYLSPFAPLKLGDLKDAIIRFPTMLMRRRPEALHPYDTWRGRAGSRSRAAGGNREGHHGRVD